MVILRALVRLRFSETRLPLLLAVRSKVRVLSPKMLRVMMPRSELLCRSVLFPAKVFPATTLLRELMDSAVPV